ncbi:MAG: helicase-related protein, partial [Thermomicrobiales bacterium]
VMDHMRRGTLNLDQLRFFVLDEADEMLDMGFIEDIEWILSQAPETRQTALFSATMPPRIAELASRYLKDPQRVSVAGKQMTVPQIRQSSYEVPRARRVDALTRILDAETPQSTMIFCRTKVGVDELGEALMARGYAVETLHGDLSQAQRDRVMRRFRSGQAEMLIATDVAARGLDIPDVSHVINYDIPESAEAYVHRIGRTGRAGRAGEAITLITPREVRWLRQIERVTRARIEPRRLPTLADVAERRRDALKQQILAVLDADDDGYTSYLETINDLADEHDSAEIAAAILKLYAEETGRTTTPEQQVDDIATFAAAAPTQRGPRSETGMVRLFINVGRNQGARPQDFVGAIANEAGIPGRAIGAIDIFDDYAFVDVPREMVDRVVGAMRGAKIKGRPVNVEVARVDGAPPARDNRGPRPPFVANNRGGHRNDGPGQRRYEPRNDRGGDRDAPKFRPKRDH